MQCNILTRVFLALSLFLSLGFAELIERQTTPNTQQPAPVAGLNSPRCMEYSRVANLSVVGANSTLRSKYFARSTVGTQYDAQMFDEAILARPAMTRDAALNAACGNLTTIAFAESDRNFSQGIIMQFRNIPTAPGTIENGIPVILSVIFCVLIMGVPWISMP